MMKRLLYVLTLTMLIIFITGCAKDEIRPNANPNHEKTTTEEVDAKDKENRPDEKNKGDRSGKQEKVEEADINHADQQTETNQTDKKDKKKNNTASKSSDDAGEADHQSGSSNRTDSPSEKSQKTPQKNSGSQRNQASEKSTNIEKDTSKPGQPKPVEKEKKPNNKSEKPAKKEKTKEEPKKAKETITVSITTGDVKGTILATTKVTYQDGDAALDPTLRILKEKGIQYSVRGSKASAYVEGIDNLYEFDEGQNSGWLIKVDGVLIDRSAGIYPVKDGSTIEWIYTTDYIKYPEGGSGS